MPSAYLSILVLIMLFYGCGNPSNSQGTQIPFPRLAFVHGDAQKGTLSISTLRGEEANSLTTMQPFIRDLLWSPDGTRILFAAQHNSFGVFNLHTMNSDGNSQIQLTNAIAIISPHR